MITFDINSKKYGTHKIMLDDDNISIISGKTIYLSKVGQFLYVRVGVEKAYLHRLVLNAPKDKVVDHKDRNTLNNTRANLRLCTIQENLRNQKRTNNKTGHTGVAIGYKGKYTAQIKVDYKKIHLGTFDTIKEALRVRKIAETKYYI